MAESYDAEFTEFAVASLRKLRRTAYLMCGDWRRAEDVAQEALIRVYRSWRRVERRESLIGYARRATVRLMIDDARRPRRRERPGFDAGLFDLRHTDVAAADTVGAVTMALLHQGSHFYSCAVTPVTWDAGIAESGRAYPGELSFAGGTTGASHKSIVTESAAWITVAAHVDTAAKTLQLSWPGGPTEQFPVTAGNVAAVFRVPTTGGLQSCAYRLLDGSGRVLEAGTTG